MTDPMSPVAWKVRTFAVWYSIRFSRNPPTNEPRIPSAMVPRIPMLSRPGRSRRAMAPMISPMTQSQMMKMTTPVMIPPLRVLCLLGGERCAGPPREFSRDQQYVRQPARTSARRMASPGTRWRAESAVRSAA